MSTFIVSFVVIAAAVAAMAVGVLFGRQPIKGSCGGLNVNGDATGKCSMCSRPCERLIRRRDAQVG